MKRLKDFITLLGVAILAAVFIGLVVLVVYHWWHGVLVGLEHFGVPMIIGAILILVSLKVKPALLLLAVIGGWASITLLGMHWFVVLSLYATTIAIFLIASILVALTAVAASVLTFVDKIRRR